MTIKTRYLNGTPQSKMVSSPLKTLSNFDALLAFAAAPCETLLDHSARL